MRRHNHIAKDLRTPKFRQRVIKNKRKDWLENLDEEDTF
jgi:hypothetical protein